MKNVFFRIMLIALLFSLGKVSAQSMLSQPLAEDPVHFANRNFEALCLRQLQQLQLLFLLE